MFFNRNSRQILFIFSVIIAIGMSACGAAPSEPNTETIVVQRNRVNTEAPAAEEPVPQQVSESVKEAEPQPSEDKQLETPADENATVQIDQSPRTGPTSNRLIIKNAELEMLVDDTDTAINRSLGIVIEYNGYVINNRTWFKDDFKYATVTIGVPVQNFEEMMRRLKGLAVMVTNETASGQDVTDQYVDLESRLRNLEATASRIRDFLDQAQDVDKALEISNQLSEVEAEIEQTKGQMTFIKERAAYSTITMHLTPQIPTPTPMPTLTPTSTPMPTPTLTPTPAWSASRTFSTAGTVAAGSAKTIFQVTVDLLIWGVVVVLPCLLPFIILAWIGNKLMRRFRKIS